MCRGKTLCVPKNICTMKFAQGTPSDFFNANYSTPDGTVIKVVFNNTGKVIGFEIFGTDRPCQSHKVLKYKEQL